MGTLLFLATPSATAAPPSNEPVTPSTTPDPAAKARGEQLFKESVEAYRRGDFKAAVALLNEAYALDPQAVLVYNLARTQEGLGDLDAAIDAYQRYLELEPSTVDRGAIEQRLVTLKKQRDERDALIKQREEEKNRPPPPPPPPHKRSVLPYVVGGVGVAGLATGTVLGLMAKGKHDDAQADPVHQSALDLQDSAEGLATASTVMFVVGGTLLAAGAVWWILDTPPKQTGSTGPRVGVGVAPGFVGIGGTLP